MKRQPIIFALTLLFVVGAALWGVNYRLDNPPLTDADKKFRALVAGVDTVQVGQMSCQTGTCTKNVLLPYGFFDKTQTRELIEDIHFLSPTEENQMKGIYAAKKFPVTLEFTFLRHSKAKPLAQFELIQTPKSSVLRLYSRDSTRVWIHRLNLRSHKRLNRTLDTYLPRRIRP